MIEKQTSPQDTQTNGSDEVDLDILHELIGYHLHRAEIASYRSFVNSPQNPKFTPKQFSVLVLAHANPGISQIAIGGALGMDRATTMAVIDKMQARKLLTRERSNQDRRKQEILLTEKGVAQIEQLKVFVKAHEDELSINLTPGEATTLRKLLIKVRRGFEN
jgi:DNA-binding MarR family transcriptional regulator